jgi:hypothetical protein
MSFDFRDRPGSALKPRHPFALRGRRTTRCDEGTTLLAQGSNLSWLSRPATALLLALALTGCDANAVVLVRHGGQDGATTDGMVDATVPQDARVDALAEAGVDATTDDDAAVPATVEVRATGYGAFVGKTIYARLGTFSANIVSTTIAADGTAIFVFPPVTFAILNNILFDTYVDVDDNGDCDRNTDDVGGRLINLVEGSDGTYRASYDRSDLSPPLINCNGL